MEVGDHVIAVAEVKELTAEEPMESLLMYVQGRYVDGDELLHHRPKSTGSK
jgi:flavin reductase (DIM6/NTAB) family NADH-FMN oxidoreductase RutF